MYWYIFYIIWYTDYTDPQNVRKVEQNPCTNMEVKSIYANNDFPRCTYLDKK